MGIKEKGRLLARGLSFGASWPTIGLAEPKGPYKSKAHAFPAIAPATGNRKERRGRAKRGEA